MDKAIKRSVVPSKPTRGLLILAVVYIDSDRDRYILTQLAPSIAQVDRCSSIMCLCASKSRSSPFPVDSPLNGFIRSLENLQHDTLPLLLSWVSPYHYILLFIATGARVTHAHSSLIISKERLAKSRRQSKRQKEN